MRYRRTADSQDNVSSLDNEIQKAKEEGTERGVSSSGAVATLNISGIALTDGSSSRISSDGHCLSGIITPGAGDSKGGDGGQNDGGGETHIE
jgi:hypothetical protein